MQPITAVPHIPDFIAGVTNPRGEVLPVIDLRKRFGLTQGDVSKDTRIINVDVDNVKVGMVVDAVTEVLRVPEEAIEPPLPIVTTVDGKEDFIQDVNAHLDAMEAGVLRLEQAADLDTLNATFRAAHTIKAIAATVGHHQMAELTHTLETLFDAMREGEVSPTQAMTDELLATVDVLKAQRDEVVTGQSSGINVDIFLARLRALTDGGISVQEAQKPGFVAPLVEKTRSLDDAPVLLTPEQAAWVQSYSEQGYAILEIQVIATADTFAQSAQLLQVSIALRELGQIIAQQPSQADLSLGRHSGHLWLVLATQTDVDMVEKVPSYVSDLAEFRVRAYSTSAAALTESRPTADTPVPAISTDFPGGANARGNGVDAGDVPGLIGACLQAQRQEGAK